MRPLLPVLAASALLLAGCTTATVDLRRDGSATVQFSRFATDADLRLGAGGLAYSSSPSAAAQQQATDALVTALAALAGLPVPARARAGALPERLASPEPPFTGAMPWTPF